MGSREKLGMNIYYYTYYRLYHFFNDIKKDTAKWYAIIVLNVLILVGLMNIKFLFFKNLFTIEKSYIIIVFICLSIFNYMKLIHRNRTEVLTNNVQLLS